MNDEQFHKPKRQVSKAKTELIGSSGASFFENNKPGSSAADLEWLTTFEAAEYLRISPDSLRNMTSNGKIPYSKLERRNRYKKEDLVRLLMANRRGDAHGTQI